MGLKIVTIDIETSPLLSWNWGTYEQNSLKIDREWYIMSFAIKELDKKETKVYSLKDFKRYKKEPTNDIELLKLLYKFLDEADVVIGHNLDGFDIKKINARFIYHTMTPPSSYKTIDTYKIAKKYFNFSSNHLNDLCEHFNIGKKLEHSGIKLWFDCMEGKEKAWNLMKKYNKMDVIINERLYKRFLPYITNHPNYGIYLQKDFVCPNCGSKHLHSRGYAVTKTNTYRRWQCQTCGSWSRNRINEKSKNKVQLTN
jgi:DNA polymerase elongation subunit (family B)